MENIVFFDANGITTTSANYITNVAKEHYMELEEELNNIRFFTTEISLMGSSDVKILRKGVTDISEIPNKLARIAHLKSFIAWFREAIKEKDRLIEQAKDQTDEEIAIILNLEYLEAPEKEDYPTMESIIAKWNIKERNRYYWLDTQCAVIGQYIHPNGSFNKERKLLAKKLLNPISLDGNGRDAILYTDKPTISTTKVDEMFFNLQSTYRSYQAELNGLKHKVETKLNSEINRIDTEYESIYKEYCRVVKQRQLQIQMYRNNNVVEKQQLKIAIPNDLKELYSLLSSKE